MLGILEGEQNNFRVKVLLAIDTYTLALHSETPLVIRSCIIPHSYELSLRVSCGRETRRHTCLLQSNPIRLLCCQKAALSSPLVFCLLTHLPSRPIKSAEMGEDDEQDRARSPEKNPCCSFFRASKRRYQSGFAEKSGRDRYKDFPE